MEAALRLPLAARQPVTQGPLWPAENTRLKPQYFVANGGGAKR